MFLYYYYFSLPLLILTNLMIMMSKSFFFMWMIMEINLISFISILVMNKFIYSEQIFNYYLIQSFNSHLFFLSNLMMNFNLSKLIFTITIFLSLLSKMGLPPFHTWYLKLMKYLNWMIFFINSSIQKFIPLIILNFMNFNNKMMFKFMIMTILIISSLIPFFSINSFSLKLMMCFSSIIQISWIMTLMIINEMNWILYFLFYSIISLSIFYIFYLYNLNYIFDFNKLNFKNKFNLYILMILILSLSGLPPFSGFLNKWMFINLTFNFLSLMLNLIFLILSLLNLFYYIRSINQIMMFYYTKINFNFKFINMNNNNNIYKINLLLMFSLMFLPIYEMI